MRKKRLPIASAMTDIAFLLLLFFLILAISTTMQPVAIDTPQARQPERREEADFELFVAANGTIHLNGAPIALTDLPVGEPVALLADKQTPYQDIEPILQQLQRSGTRTVHLVVECAP